MVKYELKVLEHIVTTKSTDGKSINSNTMQPDVASEVERIKKTFTQDLFSLSDERHLRRYIQFHQHAIIQLMDASASQQNSANAQYEVQSQLEDLLNFLLLQFPKYFDFEARLPKTRQLNLQTRLSEQSRVIADQLVTRDADVQLVDTIMDALHQIESGYGVVNYKTVFYAEEIEKALQQVLEKEYSGTDLENAIRRIMISCNYNSVRCFDHCVRYIKDELALDQTPSQKRERLTLFKKTITQSLVKPGLRYDEDSPSLSNQLTIYIEEELHRQQRISSPEIPREIKTNFQIQFEASVAQMAYLVKIFTQAGVIVNSNTTELLRFISGCIATRRSGQVSYDSIRSKYYNVEESTRQSVKVLLENVIKHLDKDK